MLVTICKRHVTYRKTSRQALTIEYVCFQSQPSEVESLRQLFKHLDEEATGTISLQQLQDAMRHMGKQVRNCDRG